jgi:hypothetical protein
MMGCVFLDSLDLASKYVEISGLISSKSPVLIHNHGNEANLVGPSDCQTALTSAETQSHQITFLLYIQDVLL